MSKSLLFNLDDAVAIVSVNDAPHNRMTLDFVNELDSLVKDIAEDDSIRAVVITAEGLENFSVGMNLKQLSEGIQQAGGPHTLPWT